MRYKAVIFDLDGTLLDTLEDLASAANRVLADNNFPAHPVAAYRTFVGEGLQTLIERILPEQNREAALVMKMMTAFEKVYAECWHARSAPYPGIASLLDYLTAKGVRLSVLSNKPDQFTRLCVRRMLPRWSFDPVFGQRPDVPKKPDPTAALEIAQLLGLSPSAILYVGDSGVDMHTARAAMMDVVGVLWGFRDADELQQAGAQSLVTRPEELLPIIFSK
ncbi:MAG: HAD family hydrolase [Desulfobulbus sp.]|nr:HAD family hydrolase [Desulfobulbus sp.]